MIITRTANRENARTSTGPRTPNGRTRSARNALRHTLSVPVCSSPALSKAIEALAVEIAGADAVLEIKELARQIAEAQIDLCRIRYTRHHALMRALSSPCYDHRSNIGQ